MTAIWLDSRRVAALRLALRAIEAALEPVEPVTIEHQPQPPKS